MNLFLLMSDPDEIIEYRKQLQINAINIEKPLVSPAPSPDPLTSPPRKSTISMERSQRESQSPESYRTTLGERSRSPEIKI